LIRDEYGQLEDLEKVAIKQIKEEIPAEMRESIRLEEKILRELTHPHINTLIDSGLIAERMHFVMEF